MKAAAVTILVALALPSVARADLDLPVENGVISSGIGWRVDPFGSVKLVFTAVSISRSRSEPRSMLHARGEWF